MTSITSPTTKLELAVDQHIATITINNPPANTWDLENLTGLRDLVKLLEEEGSTRAIVITGKGEKFFSAGADLNQFAGGDKVNSREVAERFGEAFEALAGFSGLTIAAINGYAMGGGLECALACDIRIIEEQAQVALPEATVGLLPCAGGTQRLSWLVGEAWAARMILCGERIPAETATRIGLTQSTVATGEALEAATTLAQKTLKQSPDAVKACKRLLTKAREQAIQAGLVQERDEFIDLIGEPNQLEGTNAFIEKRSPDWT